MSELKRENFEAAGGFDVDTIGDGKLILISKTPLGKDHLMGFENSFEIINEILHSLEEKPKLEEAYKQSLEEIKALEKGYVEITKLKIHYEDKYNLLREKIKLYFTKTQIEEMLK